jgi:hypothetical protein
MLNNPDHHLRCNHGTWTLHHTTHPTPFSTKRITRSLGTKDIEVARQKRDTYFKSIEPKPVWVP